jgi:hypothetical protein
MHLLIPYLCCTDDVLSHVLAGVAHLLGWLV